MDKVQARSAAVVIAFPDRSARPTRTVMSTDQPRGEILLFTGVRYERQQEPSPGPSRPAASNRHPRTGRRRRS